MASTTACCLLSCAAISPDYPSFLPRAGPWRLSPPGGPTAVPVSLELSGCRPLHFLSQGQLAGGVSGQGREVMCRGGFVCSWMAPLRALPPRGAATPHWHSRHSRQRPVVGTTSLARLRGTSSGASSGHKRGPSRPPSRLQQAHTSGAALDTPHRVSSTCGGRREPPRAQRWGRTARRRRRRRAPVG